MDLALSTPSPGAIGVALPLLLAASLLGAASASPGVNKIGCSPAGIVGSKSGTVAGYAFSAGMKKPNKMFYRLSDPTDRPERHRLSGTLKQ